MSKEQTENKIQAVEQEEAQVAAEKEVVTPYTPEEVDEILDELAAAPKKVRIWEVDFLRGLMILFVVWDHFMWDIHGVAGGSYNTGLFQWLFDLSTRYYAGVLRRVTHDVFVTMFVFTSGVSCSFAGNHGRRAMKMLIFAILLSVGTYAVSAIAGYDIAIRFNVIHVIALATFLWTIVDWFLKKCDRNWKRNVFGWTMTAVILAILVMGYCAKNTPWDSTDKTWFFLFYHKGSPEYNKFLGGDYLPFFPDFGWFLVGAFLGRILYKEKKSLFPSVNPKFVSPVTFCGRNSLWIYLLSQIVMFAFIYLFHGMLNWL